MEHLGNYMFLTLVSPSTYHYSRALYLEGVDLQCLLEAWQ